MVSYNISKGRRRDRDEGVVGDRREQGEEGGTYEGERVLSCGLWSREGHRKGVLKSRNESCGWVVEGKEGREVG